MNLICAAGFILAAPLGVIDTDPKVIPPDTKKITLLVHGFLHNRSSWIYLKSKLQHYPELGPIFTINLGSPFHSIEEYSELLSDKIKAIRRKCNCETLEINLVGHSMGGLVCLNYAAGNQEDEGIRVIKVITIASPLQGTGTANLAKGWSVAGQEMLPASDFTEGLADKVAAIRGSVEIYHISCGRDWVVPCEKSYFKGGHASCEYPKKGHFSVLLSRQVADQIAEWLLYDLN